MLWLFWDQGEEDGCAVVEECRSTKPQRVFVDLSGKRPPSAGGAMYLMKIVDDFSRLGWPHYLKKKSDAAPVFAKFLADIRADGCPSVVECVRSDNGTEFLNVEFRALLNSHCVHQELTPVASPKHDGVVERRIACKLELAMVSCLEAKRLFDGEKLPPTGPLWAEACHHASDAINMTTRVKDKPDMLSPFQTFYGRAPFARVLPFLQPGFHHLRRSLNSGPKAELCFYLSSGSNHSQDGC